MALLYWPEKGNFLHMSDQIIMEDRNFSFFTSNHIFEKFCLSERYLLRRPTIYYDKISVWVLGWEMIPFVGVIFLKTTFLTYSSGSLKHGNKSCNHAIV